MRGCCLSLGQGATEEEGVVQIQKTIEFEPNSCQYTCAICGQGELFAAIDADNDRLLLVCDDCGSQWLSPSDARSYQKAVMDEARHLQPASEQALAAAGWLESGGNEVRDPD